MAAAVQEAIEILARDPLRNIMLLKHLEAFPDRTSAHCATDGTASAVLVLLETVASPHDRRTYPSAKFAALVSSDHPDLTRVLLQHVPRGDGVVFKLASDADRDVVATELALVRATSVLSFTSRSRFSHDEAVLLTSHPSDVMFRHFAAQEHARNWLEPLLEAGRAFALALERDGQALAVAFAFENYAGIWEIGGVFSPPAFRGCGFAARVVRTALAELETRGLVPRYQTQEDNIASIRLAESIGLARFLTVTHFLHAPTN